MREVQNKPSDSKTERETQENKSKKECCLKANKDEGGKFQERKHITCKRSNIYFQSFTCNPGIDPQKLLVVSWRHLEVGFDGEM